MDLTYVKEACNEHLDDGLIYYVQGEPTGEVISQEYRIHAMEVLDEDALIREIRFGAIDDVLLSMGDADPVSGDVHVEKIRDRTMHYYYQVRVVVKVINKQTGESPSVSLEAAAS